MKEQWRVSESLESMSEGVAVESRDEQEYKLERVEAEWDGISTSWYSAIGG